MHETYSIASIVGLFLIPLTIASVQITYEENTLDKPLINRSPVLLGFVCIILNVATFGWVGFWIGGVTTAVSVGCLFFKSRGYK